MESSPDPCVPSPIAHVQPHILSCQLCFPKQREATPGARGYIAGAPAKLGRHSDSWEQDINPVEAACPLLSLQFLPTSLASHLLSLVPLAPSSIERK